MPTVDPRLRGGKLAWAEATAGGSLKGKAAGVGHRQVALDAATYLFIIPTSSMIFNFGFAICDFYFT